MEPIKISVTGALATVTQKPVLTSGTVGLNVDFTFDEAWTGLKKTAVFRCGNSPIPPVLCEDNRSTVPWEALEKPGCTLFVGVYGTDSEGIDLPTVWAEVDRVREGATVPDVDPSEPTPNAYEQLLAAAKQAAADAESVRQDADNGKFKGDQGEQGPKGDKGDAGVIDFIVVTELPADGDGSKIYLVPNATGENNNFDEFIFQNGQWEKIGSAGVEVNLDEYVKKTDYVKGDGKTAGIITVSNFQNSGLYVGNTGDLSVYGCGESHIDNRNGNMPILPARLDYAVKKALTDCKTTTWTEEEKVAVANLLGSNSQNKGSMLVQRYSSGNIAVPPVPTADVHATSKQYVEDNFVAKKTSDRTSVYAVNNKGEQILVGTSPYACNNGMIPIYNQDGTLYVMTHENSNPGAATSKGYVEGLIADIESNIFVANPDTTWQEIDDAYNAGKYIFYAFEQWGIMNIVPLCQQASDKTYVFTHIRENKYLYTVKVNKDNTRGIGSIYVVDKIDFDALVARVEALEGK